MKDLRNSEKLYDRYADAATALVMDQYVSAMAESLAAEERAPVEISAELDSRCRKLIKQGYARYLRRSIGKKLLRGTSAAVIVFLLLCGVFAVLFSTVEAIRAPIIHFFTEQKEAAPEVTDKEPEAYDRDEDVLAGRLPEGYEPVACSRSSDGDLTIRYADADDGMISYDEYSQTNDTYQGVTEDAVTENITIGGLDALLIERNGYMVIWHSASGEAVYQLGSNRLSREEIIAIAEAIESGREENLSADSDGDSTESVAAERKPAKRDYIITTPTNSKYHIDINQIDIDSVDIKDVVSENITYPGIDATLIEAGSQFIWNDEDEEQTGDKTIGWAVLP